ncbi:MAG: DUF6268 family outer membrane beta-barrel protein [Deltaproteobacteria bacterium]
MVWARLVLLSLLLGLAGCAGTQFEPSYRIPRQVTLGTPVSAAVVNQFPAHVTAGGTVRLFDVYAQGGYSQSVTEKLQIGLAANYEFAEFRFTGMNRFYNPRPWSDVYIFGAALPVMYNLKDKWNLSGKWTVLVVPLAQEGAEPGANWSRAVSYGGAVGVVYTFGKDRTIGVGVGALDNLAQAAVFPLIGVVWKFNEHLRLNTPYRAGPGGFGGLELTYIVNEDLELAVGVSYQSKRFRLSERNINRAGIGEYDNIPLVARVSYRLFRPLEVSVYGGASVFNQISIDDSKGNQLFKTHANVAPFVGVGLSLKLDVQDGTAGGR